MESNKYIIETFLDKFCVEESEMNPAVDPRFSGNGGGYHQPQYIVTSDKYPNWVLILRDESCGDFGTHYSAILKFHGETIVEAYWGTMTGKITTDFTFRWSAWISAAKALGFTIPTAKSKDYVLYLYNKYFCED